MSIVTYTLPGDPVYGGAGVAGYVSGAVTLDLPFPDVSAPTHPLSGFLTFTPVGGGSAFTATTQDISYSTNPYTSSSPGLYVVTFGVDVDFNPVTQTITTGPNGFVGGFNWLQPLGDTPNGDVLFVNFLGPNGGISYVVDPTTGGIIPVFTQGSQYYGTPQGYVDPIFSSFDSPTPGAPAPTIGAGLSSLVILLLIGAVVKRRSAFNL
jgi:hypothetical protein